MICCEKGVETPGVTSLRRLPPLWWVLPQMRESSVTRFVDAVSVNPFGRKWSLPLPLVISVSLTLRALLDTHFPSFVKSLSPVPLHLKSIATDTTSSILSFPRRGTRKRRLLILAWNLPRSYLFLTCPTELFFSSPLCFPTFFGLIIFYGSIFTCIMDFLTETFIYL